MKQSDGSDSDIPISSLKKEVKPLPKKIEDESDDDIPLSKLVSKAKVAKVQKWKHFINYNRKV